MKQSEKLPQPKHYRLLLFLQFAASAVFLFLGIHYLPLHYLLGLCLIFSMMIVLCSLMIFSRTSRFSRFMGRSLSLILSIVLIIGSAFITRSNNALINVTGAEKETVSVSIVVMNESSAQTLDDIKNGLIGYNASYDEDIIEDTCRAISKETGVSPNTDPYSQFGYLADGLYYGEADAIIFNEAYRPLFETSHEDFDSRTRVLKTFSLVSEEKLASSAVSDVTKDCFIAYISGIDARGEVTSKSRSDANMLVAVNPTTHQVLLLGIPRDYYVTIPAINAKDKLTHSGMYGINESIATLENLLDLQINYYVRINFSATVDIIDAMGGVDVNSPVAFTTLDGKYEIKQGMNHMDGNMALYFMRSRKMLAGGDNDRVSNQIRVIRAMLNKLMSFGTITNYNSILSAAETSVQTNMTSKELQKLIQMQLGDMPEWDIQNYQLSGTDLYTTEAYMQRGSRTYVMEPDMESVAYGKELLTKMLNNETISLDKME
ncbi:MAG: LCP family protein [Lachnospiraceae bacterium]|nr:LCP family protein [Lachnospiraceae bacterium]MDY4970566.1 LCP family protein [Lachnospiraceae bacterium]